MRISKTLSEVMARHERDKIKRRLKAAYRRKPRPARVAHKEEVLA